jgi:DNA-binding LacI/PurR family transcriptional regulator
MVRVRQVKLKDIAESSGVSIAAVSAALNGTGRISEELRNKIMRISREMNYAPNIMAKFLKQKHCNDIGLIIGEEPDIIAGSGLFQSIIAQYIQFCDGEESRCHIEYHNPVEKADAIPSLLTSGFVGGVLHAAYIHPKLREWLKQNPKFPFVALEEPHTCCVRSFYDTAIYKAAQHLVALGHKRIGLFFGPEQYDLQYKVKSGFMRAVKDFNIDTANDKWLFEFNHEPDYTFMSNMVQCGRKLFKEKVFPSALICGDDRIARAMIYAAMEAGIKVPCDLSLIACGEKSESERTYPALSSIECNAQELLFKATYILGRLMRGQKVKEKEMWIEPNLIIRDSVANFEN